MLVATCPVFIMHPGFATIGEPAGGGTVAYNGAFTDWTDFIFQGMFAANAATIVPGAVAERVRLEIAVNEPYVQKTIDAIVEGGRTGEIGDGKIFVVALEDCVRIRTGDPAIG